MILYLIIINLRGSYTDESIFRSKQNVFIITNPFNIEGKRKNFIAFHKVLVILYLNYVTPLISNKFGYVNDVTQL